MHSLRNLAAPVIHMARAFIEHQKQMGGHHHTLTNLSAVADFERALNETQAELTAARAELDRLVDFIKDDWWNCAHCHRWFPDWQDYLYYNNESGDHFCEECAKDWPKCECGWAAADIGDLYPCENCGAEAPRDTAAGREEGRE